jgi:mycothione reductase
MRLPDLPRRIVVLGGGFIAVEMAHIFEGLGTEVHLVHRGPRLLRHLDEEISTAFTEQAASQWHCHLERTVTRVRATGADTPAGPEVEVTLDDGTTVSADVLLATGRAPSSADLDCAATGVALHPDGRVVVDAHGRTTADGVWSLGDVSSPHQLKHVANHEARVVAHNLAVTFGRATTRGGTAELRAFRHEAVPSAIFTHPQLATVGLTEAAARDAGLDVTSYTQAYGDTAAGWAMEDGVGRCKLVAERGTGRLLGAHLMGAHAAVLIQPLIQAMATGLDVLDPPRADRGGRERPARTGAQRELIAR